MNGQWTVCWAHFSKSRYFLNVWYVNINFDGFFQKRIFKELLLKNICYLNETQNETVCLSLLKDQTVKLQI